MVAIVAYGEFKTERTDEKAHTFKIETYTANIFSTLPQALTRMQRIYLQQRSIPGQEIFDPTSHLAF